MEPGFLVFFAFLVIFAAFGLHLTPYRRIRRVRFPGDLVHIASSPWSRRASDAALRWIEDNLNSAKGLTSLDWRKIREAASEGSALATYATQRRLEKFRDELQYCGKVNEVYELVRLNAPVDRVMESAAIWRIDKIISDTHVRVQAGFWPRIAECAEDRSMSLAQKRWERAMDKVEISRERPDPA